MASYKVSSFPHILLFHGITSFEVASLPCFKHILDSFINYSIGISIYVGEAAITISDFITFFVSMNASSN